MSRLFERRHVLRGVVAGSVVALGMAGQSEARAEPEEVELEKVPAKVMKTAEAEFPKAKWTGAIKDTEDGVTSYDLEGTTPKGLKVEIEITEDGKVLTTHKEIPMEKVPKVVTSALKGKFPNFKSTSVAVVHYKEHLMGYEFSGKRPKDDDEVRVLVSEDGKKIAIDDD